MPAIHVHEEGAKALSPSSAKSGENYDVCPVDQCLEVDLTYQSAGKDPKGQEYRDWSIFNADRRDGGCGATWSRTTAQGAVRDRAIGREPMLLTQSAAVGRTVHLPPQSQEYADNYERIFGHK